VRSFIELDLFDNTAPFDNTTPIYLINLLLNCTILTFFTANNENKHLIFREFHGR